MFLEVIATSVNDCEVLDQSSNVRRIELCVNLQADGLTPPRQLVNGCLKATSIPIRVMIRYDNDNFMFKKAQWDKIVDDITWLKQTGIEGIVIGFINKDKDVDYENLVKIIEIARPLKITFHRAFDQVINKVAAIKKLRDLKIATVLTQGGTKPILNNLQVLKELQNQCVQICAGGNVNLQNFDKILQYVDAIHIGRAARIDNDWNKTIDLEKIKQFTIKNDKK